MIAILRFLQIFKPSPFKIGCLVVLLAVSLFHSFGSLKPPLLLSLDNRLTDALFRLRGTTATSKSVVIVDIDNKSLSRLGQWPWPRTMVADLVGKIHQSGARVIAFDMVFAETDRTSPKNHLDRVAELLDYPLAEADRQRLKESDPFDHDLILGNVLAQTPSVLGYVFETNPQSELDLSMPFPSCDIRLSPSSIPFDSINFIPASNAIINIDEVAQGESEGFINVFPDESGTIRKVPLFIALNSLPYPSLALEALRIGQNEAGVTIHVSTKTTKGQRNVILGASIGKRIIPTDNQGQITVNYRGPVKTFPYLSAADVLAGRQLETLQDKYVLIGTSAAGLLDLQATPFSNVYPGVEIQATVLDNFLQADPLIHDAFTEIALTYIMIIGGGILLSALLAFSTPLAGGLGGLFCIATTMASSYIFFLQDKIVGITFPLLTIITVFMVVTLFNYFFEGREKRFLHHAFAHYVSPQVVSEIIKDPATLALSGQVRNLSVLFSDIRDFTTISENLPPERLGRFMNQYLTAMTSTLLEHGGTVDKYIGDAIMAIWGAPLSDQDHAAKAVRAALASVDLLREKQPSWTSQGFPQIAIGIGINSGEMNVGNFGSDQRFDYTVIGDNVNLASRLEGLTKIYGCRILISQATRDAIGDRFFCRFIDRVRVKGKHRPVNIYEPLCEGEAAEDLRREVGTCAEAVAAYQGKDFNEAERLFSRLAAQNDDKLYSLYLQRIETFRKTPPPEDWDGVFIFTAK